MKAYNAAYGNKDKKVDCTCFSSHGVGLIEVAGGGALRDAIYPDDLHTTSLVDMKPYVVLITGHS